MYENNNGVTQEVQAAAPQKKSGGNWDIMLTGRHSTAGYRNYPFQQYRCQEIRKDKGFQRELQRS